MATHKIQFADRITEHLSFKLLYINYAKYDEAWDPTSQTYNFTQLFFILDGKGTLTIDDVNYAIKSNNFIVINPHVTHRIQTDPASRLECYACAIEDMSFQFGPGPNNPNFGIYNYESSRNKIVPLLEMMYRDAIEQSPGFEIICNDMTEILITHFIWTQKIGLISHHDPLMSRECSIAKGFIDTHYMDNISLEYAATFVGFSKFHFARLFKEFTNSSFYDYLCHRRIIAAKTLLEDDSLSITEVGRMCGFTNQSTFTRSFSAHANCTPSKYRQQIRQSRL